MIRWLIAILLVLMIFGGVMRWQHAAEFILETLWKDDLKFRLLWKRAFESQIADLLVGEVRNH